MAPTKQANSWRKGAGKGRAADQFRYGQCLFFGQEARGPCSFFPLASMMLRLLF